MSYRIKDQFYTKLDVAENCYKDFKREAKNLKINLNQYTFIEPSAGCGHFFRILPKTRRIGIDIDPQKSPMTKDEYKDLIKSDYLSWYPKDNKKYIVIGNPPFGLRGKLALDFINKSYDYADVVAFILPQLFNSDGKGVAGKRVKGYKLAYTKNLKSNSFIYPDGSEISINTVFQIWTKINIENIKLPEKKTCDNFIKVYSLSDGGKPSNTRNKNMIDKCDVYLPSTTFSGMKAYDSFYDLPHHRGYGVVINKNKREIKKLFKENKFNSGCYY
jgi:hypothetical protein